MTSDPNRLDPVVEAVRADLLRRSQLGIAKYGTTLAENRCDHKAKLQHMYEEALDFANYCKWAIMEIDHAEADEEQARQEAAALMLSAEAVLGGSMSS